MKHLFHSAEALRRPRAAGPVRRALRLTLGAALMVALPQFAQAQLRSPTYGWNLGNTLEATWSGATPPTQALINSVAAAGFNTIRIPCAWDHNADPNTHQINPSYMATVTQVVQWAQAANLTVIINAHWDGGWFEKSNFNALDNNVNTKLISYWTQIANNFKNYNSSLLFAIANEPDISSQTQANVLYQYYQNAINAIRGTGGNNATRWLVVQNMNDAYWSTPLPSDSATHLVFEAHYYAPYQYALMSEDASWGNQWYFWGKNYHSATMTTRNSTASWEESYVTSVFQKLNSLFASKGVPVLLGEFGAMRRLGTPGLAGADLDLHLASRTYFDQYIVAQANSQGVRPVYWDDGDNGSGHNTMGIFDRSTAALTRAEEARALTGGAALPPPGGSGVVANGIYKVIARHSGKALDVVGGGTADGTNVDQWTYNGGNNQLWAITHLGNNEYEIVNLKSGKALDVYGWGSANGTNVDQWTWGNGTNQTWIVSATASGYYRLTPKNATSTALDVSGVSTADGANVQLWSYTGGYNQQWSFQAP
jgi:endoglucanase